MIKTTSALYIHIPFCVKKCKYCDFTSFENYDLQDEYFTALNNEIKLQAKAWQENIFDTIFIGGGTPSSVDAKHIKEIIDTAKKHLNLDLKEVTIEANPDSVDFDKLQSYIDMGINRISFGVQAVQNELLKKIGRIHIFSDVKKSVELAHKAGFQNISIDLMAGLPTQSESDLLESVSQCTDLNVNHISMYSLKLEEGTALYHEVMGGKSILPSSDKEWEMSKKARQLLATLGYARYEISNYAKSGYESLHNLHYWKNHDYLGVGVSASSAKKGLRTTNVKVITEYVKSINDGNLAYMDSAQSTDEEYAFETLMLGLRLKHGIDKHEYLCRHNIDLDQRFGEIIASMIKRKLIISSDDILRLTDFGMDIQNSVLVEFMEGFKF